MMASSQVELASSSSPFGCVLRDHNRRDRGNSAVRDSNSFSKNFKDLWVHNPTSFRSCISKSNQNDHENDHMDYNANAAADLWVHKAAPQPRFQASPGRIQCLSGVSGGHDHDAENADLWVHKPQYNNQSQSAPSISGGNQSKSSPHSGPNGDSDGRAANAELWVMQNSRGRGDAIDSHKKKTTAAHQWDKAREMMFNKETEKGREKESSDTTLSEAVSSSFQRENSPSLSEKSVEVPSPKAVSSLVKRWRDFEAEAKNLQLANSSTVCSTRSNSGSTFAEFALLANAPPPPSPSRVSDAGVESSVDARGGPGTPLTNEESSVDWECDRIANSGPPSSRGRDSDAAEQERLRVADIIRKLTSNGDDHNDPVSNEVLPRLRTAMDQVENRCSSPVWNSPMTPRIRGRQAFTDLLMQMERDRHRELEALVESKAVSKFPQRGRLQALLRIKFLRRGIEEKENRTSNYPWPCHQVEGRDARSSNCSMSQSNAVLGLRDRLKPPLWPGLTDSSSSCSEVLKSAELLPQPSTSNHIKEVIEQQGITCSTSPSPKGAMNTQSSNRMEVDCTGDKFNIIGQQSSLKFKNTDDHNCGLSSEFLWQNTSHGSNSTSVEPLNVGLIVDGTRENMYETGIEGDSLMLNGTSCDCRSDSTHLQGGWVDEEAYDQKQMENDCGWVSDYSHTQSDWEELQMDYQQQTADGRDWVNDIARPRSEWEGLRQARYQEMLDPFLDNDDIRQLLQRRSVSGFLSSGLREQIDRLMISRSKQPPHFMDNQLQQEEQGQVAGEFERDEVVIVASRQGDQEEEDQVKDEENEDNYDDYDEKYQNEAGMYASDTSLQPLPSSWSHNQDGEVSYDSDVVASTSRRQSLSPTLPQENRTHSTLSNNSSIEMELIYDLRGHMEQLHQEMSELRRSIKSCMSMQVKLQKSIKREVAASLGQSGQKRSRESVDKKPMRGSCCICCEVQIDALLYRCGHMCTCFKCAHELQWGSGKCPVCRAPIIDVVRAHATDL